MYGSAPKPNPKFNDCADDFIRAGKELLDTLVKYNPISGYREIELVDKLAWFVASFCLFIDKCPSGLDLFEKILVDKVDSLVETCEALIVGGFNLKVLDSAKVKLNFIIGLVEAVQVRVS